LKTPSGTCFVTCENFRRELKTILASDIFSGAACKFLPYDCSAEPQSIISSLSRLNLQGYEHVHIFGGRCIESLNNPNSLPPHISIHSVPKCEYLLLPRETVDYLASQGTCPVTQGLLEKWQENLPQIGIHPEKAPLQHDPPLRKVLLLQTSPRPGSAKALRAFAEYLNLPAETLPVGLDYLTLFLRNLTLSDQAADYRRAAEGAQIRAGRLQADFTDTLDMINTLTASTGENQSIDLSLDLIAQLFNPGSLSYYPVVSTSLGLPHKRVSKYGETNLTLTLRAWLPQSGEWMDLEDGFILRLSHNTETLGFIAARSLDTPDLITRHKDGALQIARVCALTISNQRTFLKLLSSQKMADLGAMAAGVAYEINSPLQVITGMSASIHKRFQHEHDEDLLRIRLDTINRNAWRVAEITRSLITYTGSTPQLVEPNDLNQIVRDTLVLVEHQLMNYSSVVIRTELEPGMPLLPCDRNRVSQALLNLLSNSQDAMPGGGVVTIRTLRSARSRQQILSVSDNGDGIPASIQPRIFDPFFTTKAPGTGIGLGLSIVQGIVEAHHGRIDFNSTAEIGTTFNLVFPEDPGCPDGEV
jgi:signal transduction histidine kinase